MNPELIRQQAMSLRLLAVMVAALSASAFAQSDEPTPPPMVPVDQAPVDPNAPLQPAPYPGQPQYPQQQPYPQQQYPQQQQPYPQQPYPQQQQPQDQQPYPQQQDPQQQPPQYQQPPQQQQPAQRPVQPPTESTNTDAMYSSRTKHFVGLLSGAFGIASDTGGLVANVRAEIDITRIGLLLGYSNFYSTTTGIQVHQFNLMGGYAFFSSDELTLRALGGLDLMIREGSTALGPVIGTTLRSMWSRIGIDAAFMVTLFPFRSLELRAAFVIQWSVFEAHLGWRVQVVDATMGGNLGTLFSVSPGINGPVAGIGITL